ncbi:MAG TPA: hypothetical protein DEF42_05745 [Desulfosporosinus sp.]|nr:hypothetical protein [Desulfosporosinus sp.]
MKLLDNLNQVVRLLSIGKMKDSIPIGFLGGLAGTIFMDLSNIMFKKMGLSEKTYAQYAGSVVMKPFRLFFGANKLLGQILHLVTGSIIGIPLLAILKKTGKDNYLFKGAVFGTFTWELLYSFGLRYKVFRAEAHTTGTHFTTLIDNLIYGFVSSATMVFLADDSVFPKSPVKRAENTLESEIIEVRDSSSESTYEYQPEVRFH